jgi:hypothetical protein
MSAFAAYLDSTRTADEIELESLNTAIALWLTSHPGCESDLVAYQNMLSHVEAFPVNNDELTHLYVVAARDTFRCLYGYEWSLRK